MNRAITQLQLNIQATRELDKAHNLLEIYLKSLPNISVDTAEILRAEVVQAMSALDCFIHDVVRIGMLECFSGNRTPQNAYLNFGISFDTMHKVLQANSPFDQEVILDSEIRRLNGYKPFQEPSQVSNALSLIGVDKIWEKVGLDLGLSAKDVKERLERICKWRNRIVHEADIDGTFGFSGVKHPISQTTVNEAVNFIEKICNSIFNHVK